MPVTARLVSIGAVEWPSGYDYLLAAYARLHRAGVPFSAVVRGTGSLVPEIRFSIRDLGLYGVVVLDTTPVAPERAVSACDLLVCAAHVTRPEIAAGLHAAAAHGLAIVTTAIDGLPDSPRLTRVARRDVAGLTAALHKAIAR